MQMASSDLMRMRTRMFSDMMSEHAKLIERVVSSMDRIPGGIEVRLGWLQRFAKRLRAFDQGGDDLPN